MAKVVTPSPMTNGQIDKAVAHYRDMLQKHRHEIEDSESVQKVLGQPEYLAEQLAVIRKRVSAISKMIVRRVKVDRSRTRRQMLDATGRKVWYCDGNVLATAPVEGPEWVDVFFFDLDYDPTPAQLAAEYDLRNLRPDFAAQAAVNEQDPAFADERPNALQWDLQENGAASYATFYRCRGERKANVNRSDGRWPRHCRFGGVRK